MIWLSDKAGRQWRVYERESAHVPGAQSARSLIFDCREIVRRIWHYPVNWVRLAPDELRVIGQLD